MDRATQRNEIWAALSTPDVLVGSVAAVTETGSLVAASASGSKLPGCAAAATPLLTIHRKRSIAHGRVHYTGRHVEAC